jgi:hypothetical protein
VRVGCQQVNLGDRVLRASAWSEAIRTGGKVRLEDRLQDQLQRRLHHPVSDGRDTEPAPLGAARLGDQPLPDRSRLKLSRPHRFAEQSQKGFLTDEHLHPVGGPAVHPGRAAAGVAPYPIPRHLKERGIDNQVEQIIKPASTVLACPSMQFGLNLQYPRPRLVQRRPRRVGIHQRPPGMTTPPCEPAARLRHVDGFPALGLLRGLRPA